MDAWLEERKPLLSDILSETRTLVEQIEVRLQNPPPKSASIVEWIEVLNETVSENNRIHRDIVLFLGLTLQAVGNEDVALRQVIEQCDRHVGVTPPPIPFGYATMWHKLTQEGRRVVDEELKMAILRYWTELRSSLCVRIHTFGLHVDVLSNADHKKAGHLSTMHM